MPAMMYSPTQAGGEYMSGQVNERVKKQVHAGWVIIIKL